MRYIFGCVELILTTAPDVAPIACGGHAIIAPPAAIDLKDAIVGGTISVVVDRGGFVVWFPLGQTDPCKEKQETLV